jgi:hypothetical protein
LAARGTRSRDAARNCVLGDRPQRQRGGTNALADVGSVNLLGAGDDCGGAARPNPIAEVAHRRVVRG